MPALFQILPILKLHYLLHKMLFFNVQDICNLIDREECNIGLDALPGAII